MASLQAQLWTSAAVGGRRCLVKGVFGWEEGSGYEVLVWDGGVMWNEKLEEERVKERMETLNPNVEAPSSLVLSHLSSLLYSSVPAFTEGEAAGSGRTLCVTGNMSGGLPFSWQFTCSPAPHHVVENHLVGPLLSILQELCRQRKDLLEVISRKDREIQDYRDGGATLSRRNLETGVFTEKTFSTDALSSQRFEDCVREPHNLLSNKHFQTLYQSVGSKTVALKDKVNAQDTAQQTSGESEGRDTPLSSLAVQRAAPMQDEEMGRREALERKLDEERVRGKKKKKRLM